MCIKLMQERCGGATCRDVEAVPSLEDLSLIMMLKPSCPVRTRYMIAAHTVHTNIGSKRTMCDGDQRDPLKSSSVIHTQAICQRVLCNAVASHPGHPSSLTVVTEVVQTDVHPILHLVTLLMDTVSGALA